MALQITNKAGILEINGSLNAQNTNSLKNYFEALINQSNFIILSLNNIVEIDKTAFQTIILLYKRALSKNKVFYIIGQENQKVVNLFETEKLNYLLKSNAA